MIKGGYSQQVAAFFVIEDVKWQQSITSYLSFKSYTLKKARRQSFCDAHY